jgi:TldD protein
MPDDSHTSRPDGARIVGGGAPRDVLGGPSDALAATGPGMRSGLGYFSRFGIDELMVRQALSDALGSGGDFADVFLQHRVRHSYVLEDGSVNRAYTEVNLGAGVRAVRGDQTGYGYTEDLTGEGLRLAARTAAAIASGPSRPGPQELHAVRDLPAHYGITIPWEDVRPDGKLPLLLAANDKAHAADPRVRKVRVFFIDESGAILLADSDGRIIEDLQPMAMMGITCVAEQDGRREENYHNVAARQDISFFTPERLDRMASECVKNTVVLFESAQAPAGEMPVVLAAGSSGILLHEAIGHGMEADFNRKGISIYADKIGKRIAQPFVNIVDDGTQDHARGAINVDDEGSVAGKTQLVEDGVLATYLHDRISAKHYGVAPTGSGRRESYEYAPMPRMRSTYMLPGPHKVEEIVASVKKGIYCTRFTNGQVQIGAGDFTFYVKNGFLIEDGKPTRPIKDVNIIGNGPRVLERVDMVADDLAIDEGGWTCGKDGQSVPVSQGMPTVRVAAITVGGRTSQG